MSSHAAAPSIANPPYGGPDKRGFGEGATVAPASTASPRAFSAACALLDAYLASRKRLAGPSGQSGALQPSATAAQSGAQRPAPGDGSRRVVLLFRQHYRVTLSEHGDGQILISARVLSLPDRGPRRDALLTHMGRLGLGLATRYGAACVVDATEQAVWLQDRQAPDGKAIDLAIRVRSFVNALATWQKTLDRMHF